MFRDTDELIHFICLSLNLLQLICIKMYVKTMLHMVSCYYREVTCVLEIFLITAQKLTTF